MVFVIVVINILSTVESNDCIIVKASTFTMLKKCHTQEHIKYKKIIIQAFYLDQVQYCRVRGQIMIHWPPMPAVGGGPIITIKLLDPNAVIDNDNILE
jgi:hypothetical protein